MHHLPLSERVYDAAVQRMDEFSVDAVYGYEMLARLRRPGGHSAPGESMALWAKGKECLIDLDQKMAQHIARIFFTVSPPRLFINLSWATIEDEAAFEAWLEKVVAERPNGAHLVVEVCENSAMGTPAIMRHLEAIRAAGIGLAVDDFGRGRAIFEVLEAFDWDYCKIPLRGMDKSIARFILKRVEDRRSRLSLIIEEVEDNTSFLHIEDTFGPFVDAIQGYAIHRPCLVENTR